MEDKEAKQRLIDVNGTDSSNLTTSEGVNDAKKHQNYTLYPWRWVIVIFFSTSVTASGLGMIGFSTIVTVIQEMYGVNDFIGQLLMLVFALFYIPLMFPANYLIENKGIVIPILISSVALLAGAWIRQLVFVNFYFVLAGQILMAIGQPFMMTAPAKLAGLWFSDAEQAIAITLGSLAQPLGAVIGFLLPLLFVKDSDKTDPDGKSHFELYILVQNIIITVLGVPIMFLVRNKPPTPPSESAKKMLTMKIDSQFVSIWKMVRNPDYLTILGAFSFIFSVYITLGTTVGQLTEAFDFGTSDNSIFGTVFIIAGLIGSFAHAIPLDIYQFYKYQYILIGFTWILSMVALTITFGSGKTWLVCIALGFLGVAQLPIIGVSYAFAAEVTFPVNEAHSWGFLQLIGSIIASGIATVVGIFLDNEEKYLALYTLLGAVTIGFIFTFFTRDTLNKTIAGRRNSVLRDNATLPVDTSKNMRSDEILDR